MSIKDTVNNFYSKAVKNFSNKSFFVAIYKPSSEAYHSDTLYPDSGIENTFKFLKSSMTKEKIFLNEDDFTKIKGFRNGGNVIGLSKKLLDSLDNTKKNVIFFIGNFYEENILDFGFEKNSFKILEYSNQIKNLAKNLREQSKNSVKKRESDTPSFFSQDYFTVDYAGNKTDLNHVLHNLNGKKIVWSNAERHDIKADFSYFNSLEEMAKSLGKSIKDKYVLLRVTPCLWKGCSNKLPFNNNLFNGGKFFENIKNEYNDSISNIVEYTDWRVRSIDEDKLEKLGKLIGQNHIIFKYFEMLFENKTFWTGKVKPTNVKRIKLKCTPEFHEAFKKYEEYDLVDDIVELNYKSVKLLKMVDFYYENHPEENDGRNKTL